MLTLHNEVRKDLAKDSSNMASQCPLKTGSEKKEKASCQHFAVPNGTAVKERYLVWSFAGGLKWIDGYEDLPYRSLQKKYAGINKSSKLTCSQSTYKYLSFAKSAA